jgi:hypothetical protein
VFSDNTDNFQGANSEILKMLLIQDGQGHILLEYEAGVPTTQLQYSVNKIKDFSQN